ncbi:MAG: twin-arginine translocation signal domain-containing protein, partial [Dehalococcoidia bacterium]
MELSRRDFLKASGA